METGAVSALLLAVVTGEALDFIAELG